MTRRLILALLFFCMALTLAACNKPAPPQFGAMPVQVVKVRTQEVADSSTYLATLRSRQFATLRPDVEGQVTQILVRPGDNVRQGQVLLQIRPDEQQAAVASAQASSLAASSQIRTVQDQLRVLNSQRQAAQSELNRSQKDYDRYAALFAQQAVSQNDLDRVTDTLQKARSSLDAVNAQIQAQQSAVNQAQQSAKASQAVVRAQQARLAYFSIKAPFSGVVGDIPVKVGDYVIRGAVLTTLTQDNGPLDVDINVPKELKARLYSGMQLELLDSAQNAVDSASVNYIAPSVDMETQTILVKGRIANPQNNYVTEETMQARLIWSQHTGITVPITAVIKTNGQNFVFVPAQARGMEVAKQLPVELGVIQGNEYEVRKGLKPGDSIIISGLQTLFEGAPIMTAKPPAQKAQAR